MPLGLQEFNLVRKVWVNLVPGRAREVFSGILGIFQEGWKFKKGGPFKTLGGLLKVFIRREGGFLLKLPFKGDGFSSREEGPTILKILPRIRRLFLSRGGEVPQPFGLLLKPFQNRPSFKGYPFIIPG